MPLAILTPFPPPGSRAKPPTTLRKRSTPAPPSRSPQPITPREPGRPDQGRKPRTMTAIGKDTLGTRDTLKVGETSYSFYSLAKAAKKLGDISRLPFSMKVLLENMLRFEDG